MAESQCQHYPMAVNNLHCLQEDEAEEGDPGHQGAQRAGEGGPGCEGCSGVVSRLVILTESNPAN